ncbi:MAG: hypothetical protein FE041_01375 [Thermoplasmata archaeon]|nr:MAG: hypothetical protein FE041_01375 [Thermoplasmata archaeon]
MIIDAIRLIVGGTILSYASYTDCKYREASNKLWIIMACIGIPLLFFYSDSLTVALSIIISFLLGFILYLFGMGGADTKAIWAIAILSPLSPQNFFPLAEFPVGNFPAFLINIFPLTVLVNSLLLILPLPLIFFFYNLWKKHIEFPYCFFGYKIKGYEAEKKFVWAMEKNGKKSITPKKDVDFSRYGNREIWVTPKLPFLLFICVGYISSFIFGSYFFALLSFLFSKLFSISSTLFFILSISLF